MRFRSFLYVSTCLFFLGQETLLAQLSGVINTYVKVSAVDYTCSKITVNSVVGFAAGDKVLLIQMQGASITLTNTINYGDITAIGDAGNYEFAVIDHFMGTDVFFKQTLLKTYTPLTGSVQMISVPQYNDVSIDGELNARPWDGNTGGVIVMEASGTVTLNANINASEQGFRGGDKSLYGGNCTVVGQNNFFFNYPTTDGGQKGEGLSASITTSGSGRAKNSIGGGGGNNHNTGGGGGGNFGLGGRGGDKKNTGCAISPNPWGYGALGLGVTYYSTALNKIFMGGGGGGGQVNNSPCSYNGGDGGGIIIIQASSINANGYSIKSNGGSVSSNYITTFDDNGDGNSGGGAAGTVLLNILNYSSTTSIESIGGKGGNTGYTTYDYGPGGGGGGGVVWHSTSSTSGLVAANVAGGNAGRSGLGGGNGSGTAWGSTSGGAGTVLNSLSMPSSTSASSCALPVDLLFFKAKYSSRYHVQIDWTTTKEKANAYFTLEKSTDGLHFQLLTTITGKENSTNLTTYTYNDEISFQEVLYYRLTQTDIDGTLSSLGVQVVYPEANDVLVESVFPNPFEETLNIQLPIDTNSSIQQAYFINTIGDVIFMPSHQQENQYIFETTSLPAGLYTLVLQEEDRVEYVKVVKK